MKSLREKIEAAFKAYLEQTIETGVYPGLGAFDVEYPATICSFLGGEDIHPEANTISAEVLITVISSADPDTVPNAAEKHNTAFGKVVDACEQDNLAESLMAAGTDLLVNGIESTTEELPDIEADSNETPIFTSGYKVQLIAGHN
jgi:hypothetical protein